MNAVAVEPAPASHGDERMAQIAAAIGDPARARMLCCLMDGHARTATELAAVGGIGASTASSHLARLVGQKLVDCQAQGKHRYFCLSSTDVSRALEALLVIAGTPGAQFIPTTPDRLRAARTCYDHMAGALAVALHDYLLSQKWLIASSDGYALSADGRTQLLVWGLDVDAACTARRRFACPCMDWSERRPHLAGALGAALLQLSLERGWVQQDLDSRALRITAKGTADLALLKITPAA